MAKKEGQSMPLLDKLPYLFSSPRRFFGMASAEGIGPVILTYLVVSLFSTIMSSLLVLTYTFLFPGGFGYFPYDVFGRGFSIIVSVTGFVVGIGITFAYAGLIHAVVRLFGGAGTYTTTYKAFAYALVPFQLLAIIPIFGYLSIFYSIVLSTIGLSTLHTISKGKAFLAVVLPFFLIIGVLIIVIVGIVTQSGFGFFS